LCLKWKNNSEHLGPREDNGGGWVFPILHDLERTWIKVLSRRKTFRRKDVAKNKTNKQVLRIFMLQHLVIRGPLDRAEAAVLLHYARTLKFVGSTLIPGLSCCIRLSIAKFLLHLFRRNFSG
jgi:hypothetical protein